MRLITFRRLEIVSFCHSIIYLALLVCAFIAAKPQPETLILGLSHGLLWIGMSLVCIAAARARIIPFWLAVTVAVIGGVFLVTLLVVSVLTVRLSDMVLDSRVGALDRTLGFLFGLARGLVIVVVAFIFFTWLVPDRSQPEWVKSAKSRVVLTGTGQWLMSMLPEDPESTILKKLKRPRPEETDTPDSPPDQHSELPGVKGTVR